MLENVKMKTEHESVISKWLGLEPVVINSSLVSATRAFEKHKAKVWPSGKRTGNMKFPTDRNGKAKTLTVFNSNGGRETNHIIQLPRGFNNGGPLHGDKSSTVSSNCWHLNNLLSYKGKIRRLTPIECERLQTVPDNYTEGVSNTQRYKMLGNGWTVDVIAHIFRQII
jgi:site-specific DNA-cytosine methylase